jgi:uncharacterized membrane protein
MQTPDHRKKAATAGMLLGIGLGGFVDGIALHQILQWHNMLSNWLPPTTMEAMQRNMVWDGLFHALVWLVTLLGVFLLWSAAYHQETMPALWANCSSGGACSISWKESLTTRFLGSIMCDRCRTIRSIT